MHEERRGVPSGGGGAEGLIERRRDGADGRDGGRGEARARDGWWGDSGSPDGSELWPARPQIAPLGARFEDVRSIAVLRGGGLGDVLFALPAIRSLAAAYPGARVTLLGSRIGRDLLEGRGDGVDAAVVLPPIAGVGAPADTPRTSAVETFLAAQRLARYDLAVQLHGGGRYSNALVNELGARHAVGARTRDAPRLERTIDFVHAQHEVVRALEIAGLAGAPPVSLEPRLDATAAERRDGVRACGEGRPIAVVHPGATDPRRRWPADRFAAVCARLAEEGARVLAVGTADEHAVCASVVSTARERLARSAAARVVDLSGRLSLRELVGTLACADVLVGDDSGPRHLAQALGTRTVSVYWIGNVVNAGPLGRGRHRVHTSWTTSCPVCGADCTDPTAERCPHDDSFVADVPVRGVAEDAAALMADSWRSRERIGGGWSGWD